MQAVSAHWRDVALKIYVHLDLTERAYQKLVHLLSKSWAGGKRKKVRLPNGTKMALLPSKAFVLDKMAELLEGFGMESSDFKTNLDPAAVIQQRLQTSVYAVYLDIEEGRQVRVQILADATGIWKKNKVNATAIVLKVTAPPPPPPPPAPHTHTHTHTCPPMDCGITRCAWCK